MDPLLYSAYRANRALSAPALLGSATALRLLEAAPENVRSHRLARHLEAASSVVDRQPADP